MYHEIYGIYILGGTMYKRILLLFILILSISQAREIPRDSLIQGRLNIINGASTECVMHNFYTQSGWTPIKGEIGRNGIDGLYYKKKNGTIKEVLVAESKWNTSRLGRSGKNKAVKQMSQEWVLRTMNKLIKKMPSHTYNTLKRFIENNQYRARLFRLKPKTDNTIQISIYKIKNKGMKAFDEIKDTQLPPIDINAPKGNFEKRMVMAYNICRDKYLHRYLGVLTDSEIMLLLRDNYIQKKDVKKILHAK